MTCSAPTMVLRVCRAAALTALGTIVGCAGTETDNPIASGGSPSEYESKVQWTPGSDGVPPCLPSPEVGKPRRLPLWERDGELVIGADAYAGLQVLDASDPLQPRIVGELDLAGDPRALVVEPGPFVNLVIEERPELVQTDVPEPNELEPATRLVRYDVRVPGAIARMAEVAIEGELWRVVERGATLWVMSAALVEPTLTCDAAPFSCGYVDRKALLLTAYRFMDGAWQTAQRVELPMNVFGWSTAEGFASFEARYDVFGDPLGGTLHVARFTDGDLLDEPLALAVGSHPAPNGPLSLAGDQARLFALNLTDGTIELETYDLASGALLSTVEGFGQQFGPGTRYSASAVYVGDEGLQQGATLVDLSDPGTPVVTPFPEPVSQVLPLDDEGARLLGVGQDPSTGATTFVLMRVQDGAISVLDQRVLDGDLQQPVSDALWQQDDRVLFRYRASDEGSWIGGLVASDTALTLLSPVAVFYGNEVVVAGDVVYAPDYYGMTVGSFSAAPGEEARLDWTEGVLDYVVAGDYEAALVEGISARTLELIRGDQVSTFEAAPYAQRLIAGDDRLLVLSSTPRDQCEQAGLDCTDYGPHVAIYSLGDAPTLRARVPMPDADLVVQADDRQTWMEWETVEQAPFALGGGRYLFVAAFDATCTSVAACDALGIEARPIDEANVNVATPGDAAPCPPGASQCEQPEPAPVPTVYGNKHAQRFYVLDVTAEDPSFGEAVESVLELDNSHFGPPRVSNDTVLAVRLERAAWRPTPGVTSYAPRTARFMLDRFELGEDGSLHARPPINIPGYPLALASEGAVLISAEPDPMQEGGAILHRLTVDDRGSTEAQRLALPASYAQVEVAFGKAFYLHELGMGCEGTTRIVPIELPEGGVMRALPALELPGVHWTIADAQAGRLLLQSHSQRYAVIDVSGDDAPAVISFVSMAGQIDRPRLDGGTIVGAGSLWGRQRVDF